MKTAHLAGFKPASILDKKAPAKGDGKQTHAAAPNVHIEFELAKNLVAGSNLGLGNVLVYGSLSDQAEVSL